RIMRWPCYVRDRHAARSRPTAGVLATAKIFNSEVLRPLSGIEYRKLDFRDAQAKCVFEKGQRGRVTRSPV
ncbi:MAG TPA: hypothetical protein VFD73_16570, partial [Gemmatimonadales bacterium]|nr:hypothetical protein [Gemmatimonadales bacterium]